MSEKEEIDKMKEVIDGVVKGLKEQYPDAEVKAVGLPPKEFNDMIRREKLRDFLADFYMAMVMVGIVQTLYLFTRAIMVIVSWLR